MGQEAGKVVSIITRKRLLDVVRRVNSDTPAIRQPAQDELKAMGPRGIEMLLDELKRTPPTQRRVSMFGLRAALVSCVVGGVTLVIALIVGLFCLTDGASGFDFSGLFCGGGGSGSRRSDEGSSLSGGVYQDWLHARHWNQILRALACLDDIHIVGALVEGLAAADEQTRSKLELALTRILPQVRSEHACHFTASQRACLHTSLTDWKAYYAQLTQERLALATLAAFEHVGEASDLRAVETACCCSRPVVATAAQNCFSILHSRVENERMQQMLLRGTSQPTSDPATLLRAPQDVPQPAAPNQLLRAAE